jgi:hypothetical protein
VKDKGNNLNTLALALLQGLPLQSLKKKEKLVLVSIVKLGLGFNFKIGFNFKPNFECGSKN